MNDQLNAVIYTRTATVPQTPDVKQAQIGSLYALAASNGLVVTAKFTDWGESGDRLDRPGLTCMLAYIADAPADFVLVSDLTRLARDSKLLTQITNQLCAAGVSIMTLRQD